MDNAFDGKAEAQKIQNMAFSCLDDNSSGHSIQAAQTEIALSKELATFWGDPDKLTAVALEIQRSGPTWGFHQVELDFGNQPLDVTGIDFQNVSFRYPNYTMSAKNLGDDVVVSVGKPDENKRFAMAEELFTAKSPIIHPK